MVDKRWTETETPNVKTVKDRNGGDVHTVDPYASAYRIEDNSGGISIGPNATSRPDVEIDLGKDLSDNPKSCLDIAADLVDGDRNKVYGDPATNHGCTGVMFGAFLRRKYGEKMPTALDAEDVCIFNICQKISRLANAYHEDSPVDIAGYARNLQLVHEALERSDNGE